MVTASRLTSLPLKSAKYVWRNMGVRSAVLDHRLKQDTRRWREARERISERDTSGGGLLIIPSDPSLLTASVGDQAMIEAIMAYWRDQRPGLQVYFAVTGERAAEAAVSLGAEPLRMNSTKDWLADVCGALRKTSFDVAVLMGADGLDGSYDPSFSGRQIMTLDLAVKSGASGFITGFSVSKVFHRKVVELFKEIDAGITINLRDPISLDRFEAATGINAKQVLDVAFLLKPNETARVTNLTNWIEAQRAAGYLLVGINAHPLLLELDERDKLPELVSSLAACLREIASNDKVRFLFVSHDSRGSSSDHIVLQALQDALRDCADLIKYPEEQLEAGEIKALVRKLDAMVTGRMHLMIASLGASLPVFGIEYKDKMKGLLNILDLPSDDLTSADQLMNKPNAFIGNVKNFLSSLDHKRQLLNSSSKKIKDLAVANFES